MKNKKKIQEYSGGLLPVMESFNTIQGEGFHKGSAAYFIRLAGCDVGCHWCDVKDSWDYNKHQLIKISDLVCNIKSNSKIVVITGGEPLMWNLGPLTNILKKNNFLCHLETSGAHPLSGIWDWICLSPKKNKLPIKYFFSNANELKIIIYNRNDFNFAEKMAKKVNNNCKLLLQPEWSKREKVMSLIVEYVLKNSNWKISLQTHKYLKIR